MSEPEYIAYFEFIARKHRAIAHSDTQTSFFVVKDDNLAEVQQAVRDTLHLPALLLDQYIDDVLTDNDNYRLLVKGGFSVLETFESGNQVDMRQARAEARRIAGTIINRIRRDCLAATGPLASFRILPGSTYSGDDTPIVSNTSVGWSYNFMWTMPRAVALNPDDWLDEVV